MSNNDGADFARSISAGEELSRLMVEAEYLREENKRLREFIVSMINELLDIAVSRDEGGEGKE
jgi:hypothetical protein